MLCHLALTSSIDVSSFSQMIFTASTIKFALLNFHLLLLLFNLFILRSSTGVLKLNVAQNSLYNILLLCRCIYNKLYYFGLHSNINLEGMAYFFHGV